MDMRLITIGPISHQSKTHIFSKLTNFKIFFISKSDHPNETKILVRNIFTYATLGAILMKNIYEHLTLCRPTIFHRSFIRNKVTIYNT